MARFLIPLMGFGLLVGVSMAPATVLGQTACSDEAPDPDRLPCPIVQPMAPQAGVAFSGPVAKLIGWKLIGESPANFSGSVDWGDGQPASTISGSATNTSGVFVFNASHTFASAGTPKVHVTISLNDTSPPTSWVCDKQIVVLSPPGFVAGSYPLHTSGAIVVRSDGESGYQVDGNGVLHPFGGAPPLSTSATWGADVVRGAVLRSDDLGGYVLDGYGGVHPFGSAPPVTVSSYWTNWDIARGIVLIDDYTGLVLDGFGALHPFFANGSQPPAQPVVSAYWPNWDIARGVAGLEEQVVMPGVPLAQYSGVVLDGLGGVHPYFVPGHTITLPDQPAVSAYWPNWDIARGIVTVGGGTVPSGYTLDGFGALHPFGDAGATPGSQFRLNVDVYRGLAVKRGSSITGLIGFYGENPATLSSFRLINP